ncbi:MAG: hypothetical protein ACJAVV_000157 [Alphaproteobacteria bacterium]|jgi:hypothetical protein
MPDGIYSKMSMHFIAMDRQQPRSLGATKKE